MVYRSSNHSSVYLSARHSLSFIYLSVSLECPNIGVGLSTKPFLSLFPKLDFFHFVLHSFALTLREGSVKLLLRKEGFHGEGREEERKVNDSRREEYRERE